MRAELAGENDVVLHPRVSLIAMRASDLSRLTWYLSPERLFDGFARRD